VYTYHKVIKRRICHWKKIEIFRECTPHSFYSLKYNELYMNWYYIDYPCNGNSDNSIFKLKMACITFWILRFYSEDLCNYSSLIKLYWKHFLDRFLKIKFIISLIAQEFVHDLVWLDLAIHFCINNVTNFSHFLRVSKYFFVASLFLIFATFLCLHMSMKWNDKLQLLVILSSTIIFINI